MSFLTLLKTKYPEAKTALNYNGGFQLLVAVVLSAQSTDKKVNEVTEELFSLYPDAKSMSDAKLEDIEDIIMVLGLWKNKAKNIKGIADQLTSGKKVYPTISSLTSFPGVGRKTANMVIGELTDNPTGISVDTHVKRVAYRIGITKSKNVNIIEKDLMEKFPKSEWVGLSHRLIFHGRETCKARVAHCDKCIIYDYCERNGF